MILVLPLSLTSTRMIKWVKCAPSGLFLSRLIALTSLCVYQTTNHYSKVNVLPQKAPTSTYLFHNRGGPRGTRATFLVMYLWLFSSESLFVIKPRRKAHRIRTHKWHAVSYFETRVLSYLRLHLIWDTYFTISCCDS